MNVSLWVRNNLTDRANAPLRRQLTALVPDGARVVEVGCANGRFLHELAPRISAGLGLDLDAPLIAYARQKARQAGHGHLQFVVTDARQVAQTLTFEPTVAVASLCLHEMERETAVHVLQQLGDVAGQLLIADFVEPDALFQRAFLHFDEWLAGHYGRYLAYRDNGGMPVLLSTAGQTVNRELATRLATVHIWVCEGNR
jgi:SAM-dependent methyltransferase